MNLPNKLTVLRIILVPLMVAFLLCDFQYHFWFAGIVFGVASITDFFDGQIARKQNLITNFGKFADPLADKILVISAFICFVDLHLVSSVPVIIIVFREFMVTSVRLIAAKSDKVIPANIFGKLKTVSQILAIVVVILSTISTGFSTVRDIFVWTSVLFTVISGIIYVKENKEFLFAKGML